MSSLAKQRRPSPRRDLPQIRALVLLAAVCVLVFEIPGKVPTDGIVHAFGQSAFDAHGACFLWYPSLLWSFVGSNGLIALSYYSTPVALIYFARKRRDLAFRWVFLVFGAFILACGTSHVMDIVVLWVPVYWYQAAVDFYTATFSVGAAIAVWWIMPTALSLPSSDQIAHANVELRQLTARLEREIVQRAEAETQIKRLNASLEARVLERTAQLEAANRELQAEIARRARVESRLNEEQRRKDEFIAMTSHELRTPVTGMKVYVQVLAAQATRRGDVSLRQALTRMEDQVNRLIRLINDLLDLSRLQMDTLRYCDEPFDLSDLLRETVDQLQGISPHVFLWIEECVPAPILGDRERLAQVLTNVMNNAIKFSPPSGTIRMTLRRHDDVAVLAVRDEGPGIHPSDHDRIFEPFQQSKAPTAQTYPGLGLGLALAREIVAHHRGRISVESTLGEGACFIISLPLFSPRKPFDSG